MYAVQVPADKLEIDHGNNSKKWNWFVDENDRLVSTQIKIVSYNISTSS